MVEMSFLETLKTFVPKKQLLRRNGIYLLSTNLNIRKVVNGKYTSVEELRKVLVEEIRELEATHHNFSRSYWCPYDASFDEIRLRLESLFRLSGNSHPRKQTIYKYLDDQESERESWHYCY